MELAKKNPEVAFPVSAQYKKNQKKADQPAEKCDVDEDGEVLDSTCDEVSKPKAGKLKKKKGPKKSKKGPKKSKAKMPQTSPNEQAPEEKSCGGTCYKAGELMAEQKNFVDNFMKEALAAGKPVTRAEARQSWQDSQRRAEILSTLPLPELKRRKFVKKECTINPFKARIDALAS